MNLLTSIFLAAKDVFQGFSFWNLKTCDCKLQLIICSGIDVLSMKTAIYTIMNGHFSTLAFRAPVWFKPFARLNGSYNENTQDGWPSWMWTSSRKYKSKKYKVIWIVKSMGLEPTSKSKRLIGEGIWSRKGRTGVSIDGFCYRVL